MITDNWLVTQGAIILRKFFDESYQSCQHKTDNACDNIKMFFFLTFFFSLCMLITFYKNFIINSTFTAVYSMPTNKNLAQHPWVLQKRSMVFLPWESLKPKPPAPLCIDCISRSTQTGTSNSQVLRCHRISSLVIYNSKFKHQSIRETLCRKLKKKPAHPTQPFILTSNPSPPLRAYLLCVWKRMNKTSHI